MEQKNADRLPDFTDALSEFPHLALQEFLNQFEPKFLKELDHSRDKATSSFLMDALAVGLRNSELYVIERSLALIDRHFGSAKGIEESVILCLTNHQQLSLALTLHGLEIVKKQASHKVFTGLVTLYKELLHSSTSTSRSTAGKDPKSLPNVPDWKRLAILQVLLEIVAVDGKSNEERKQFFVFCLSDTSAVRSRITKKSWKALKIIGDDPRVIVLEVMNCYLSETAIILPYCSQESNGSLGLLAKQRFLLSIIQNASPLFIYHLQLKAVIDKMIKTTPLLDVSEFIWIYQHFPERLLENEISYLMFRAFYDERTPSIKALFLKLIAYFWKKLPGLFIHEMMNFLLFYTNDVDKTTTNNTKEDVMHVIPPCSLQVAFRTFNNQMEYYKYNIPDLPKSIINRYLLSSAKQYPYNMLVANIQYEIYQQLTYDYLAANPQWLRKVTPMRMINSYFAIKRFDKQAMLYPLLASLPLDHADTEAVFDYFYQLLVKTGYPASIDPIEINGSNNYTLSINAIFTFLFHLPLNESMLIRCHEFLFDRLQQVLQDFPGASGGASTKSMILNEIYRLYNAHTTAKMEESYYEMKIRVLAKLRPSVLALLLEKMQSFMGSEVTNLYLQFLLQYLEEIEPDLWRPLVLQLLSNRQYLNRYQSVLQQLLARYDFETRWSLFQQIYTSTPGNANFSLIIFIFYDSSWSNKQHLSFASLSTEPAMSIKELQDIAKSCDVTRQLLERLPSEMWTTEFAINLLQHSVERNHYLEYFLYLLRDERMNSNHNSMRQWTDNLIMQQFNSHRREDEFPWFDRIGIYREIIKQLRQKLESFNGGEINESLEWFQCIFPDFQCFTVSPDPVLLEEELSVKRAELIQQLLRMEQTFTTVLSSVACQVLESLIKADFFNYQDYQLNAIDGLLQLLEKYQLWIPEPTSSNLLFAISYRNIHFYSGSRLVYCLPQLYLSLQLIFRMETIPAQTLEDIDMILTKLGEVSIEKGQKRIPYEEMKCYCLLATRYPKYFPTIASSLQVKKPRSARVDPYTAFVDVAIASRRTFLQLQTVVLPSGKMIAHDIADFTAYQQEFDQLLLDVFRRKAGINAVFQKHVKSYPQFFSVPALNQKIISFEYAMTSNWITAAEFPLLLSLLQIYIETETNSVIKAHPYHCRLPKVIEVGSSGSQVVDHGISSTVSPHVIFSFAMKLASVLSISKELQEVLHGVFKNALQHSFYIEMWSLEDFSRLIIFPIYQLYLQLLRNICYAQTELDMLMEFLNIINRVVLGEQLLAISRISNSSSSASSSTEKETSFLLSSFEVHQIRICQLLVHFLHFQSGHREWELTSFIQKEIFYNHFFKQRLLQDISSLTQNISSLEEIKILIERQVGASIRLYLEIVSDYSEAVNTQLPTISPEVVEAALMKEDQGEAEEDEEERAGAEESYYQSMYQQSQILQEELLTADQRLACFHKYQELSNDFIMKIIQDYFSSLVIIAGKEYREIKSVAVMNIILHELLVFLFFTNQNITNPDSVITWTKERREQLIEIIFQQLLLPTSAPQTGDDPTTTTTTALPEKKVQRKALLYFSDAVLVKLLEFTISEEHVRNPSITNNNDAVDEEGPATPVVIQKDYIHHPIKLCFRDGLYQEMFDYIAPMLLERLSEKRSSEDKEAIKSSSSSLPAIGSSYYQYLVHLCQENLTHDK